MPVIGDPLVKRIQALLVHRSAPLVVALDGRSGAGKSTLAVAVAAQLDATVVDGDDFYAGGTGAQWDAMTAPEKVDHCVQWRRQRPVLEALRRGGGTTYHPYDWDGDTDGPAAHLVTGEPAAVVILEGAYSARPELADLVDLRVLLDVPAEVRRAQLLGREGDTYRAEWEARWSEAEEWYFGQIMPPEAFDLILR